MSPARLLAHATAVLLLVAAIAPARADVRLEGSAADVQLEARDATLTEIFAALAKRFDLRLRGTPPDRRITTTFHGPLRRVVMRLLEGSNYVIHSQGAAVEVLVTNGASVQAGAPVRPFTLHPRAH